MHSDTFLHEYPLNGVGVESIFLGALLVRLAEDELTGYTAYDADEGEGEKEPDCRVLFAAEEAVLLVVRVEAEIRCYGG